MNRRRFMALAAASLGATGLGSLLRFSPPSPILNDLFPLREGPFNLQSSYQGRIRQLFTCRWNPTLYSSELEAMAQYFQAPVTVFTTTPLSDLPTGVQQAPIETQKTGWLRDEMLVTTDSLLSNALAHRFREMSHGERSAFAEQVRQTMQYMASSLQRPVYSTPFLFEGGQVLKAARHTLVPDFYDDSQALPFAMELDNQFPAEAFAALVGPTLFVPASAGQRALLGGHLDEYITVLDRERLAVADVSLGLQIVGDLDQATRTHYEQYINEQIAVTVRRFDRSKDIPPVRFAESHDQYAEQLQELFNTAVRYLESHYAIDRLPFVPLVGKGVWENPFISYNNALVELDRRKCAVPTYGLPSIDQEGIKVFQKAGYDPLTVPCEEAFVTKGAVHCNYVEIRGEKQEDSPRHSTTQ